jgi:hypothetical protein
MLIARLGARTAPARGALRSQDAIACALSAGPSAELRLSVSRAAVRGRNVATEPQEGQNRAAISGIRGMSAHAADDWTLA